MSEHTNAFDERFNEYVKDNGFTPALFQAMMLRHKEHLDDLKGLIKDVSFEMRSSLKDVTLKLSSLQCDKHEGERKVLETRIKALENKPSEDKRLIYISMIGCGAIGGGIMSGALSLGKLVSHLLGN